MYYSTTFAFKFCGLFD